MDKNYGADGVFNLSCLSCNLYIFLACLLVLVASRAEPLYQAHPYKILEPKTNQFMSEEQNQKQSVQL